jgi:soluble lytic murein transglycosylase-like protein
LSVVIPLIDRIADHPSDPIARQAAAARSAGQGRPHGRRSLALDRSEHGGRLMTFGRDSLRSPRYLLHPRIMQACAICIALALLRGPAAAEPAAQPRPSSTFAERFDATDPWATAITEASRRFDIPETWIRAIMRVESRGDVRAVSPKGAMGLMQIMPPTWDELRARHGLGSDPFDPRDNIIAGVAYLAQMRDRYGMPGALAAYNAGPARYEEHKLLGVPLPGETTAYLDKLTPVIGDAAPSLFAGSSGRPAGARKTSLFAIDVTARSGAAVSPAQSLFAADKRRDRQAETPENNSPDVQKE